MRTGQLLVTAANPGPVLTTQAKRTTAFIDFGSGTASPSQPVNEAIIDFNANVTITGAELTIDAFGNIHTVPGISAQNTGTAIDVADITNPGSGTAKLTASSGGSQNVSGTATFAYSAGVNILNESSKNLVISKVDLSKSSAQANLSVSPSKPAGFTTSTTTGGTSINITQTGQGNITLNGAIINPMGPTTVIDQNGSILAGAGESMRTASATLTSTQRGSIGNTAASRLSARTRRVKHGWQRLCHDCRAKYLSRPIGAQPDERDHGPGHGGSPGRTGGRSPH